MTKKCQFHSKTCANNSASKEKHPVFTKRKIMASTNIVEDFDLSFEISFKTIIRGHHVYNSIWTSSIGQVLLAQPDERKEALDYDKYAVGIFKHKKDISGLGLVGHVPVELSKQLNQFLKADTRNCIYVEVIGKRKREVGLVVPAKFSARTKCSRTARVLDEQLLKIKEQFSTMVLKLIDFVPLNTILSHKCLPKMRKSTS